MRYVHLFTAAAVFSKASSFLSHTRAIARHDMFSLGRCQASAHAKRSIAALSSSSNDSAPDPINVSFETASSANTMQIEKGELLRSAMLKRGLSPHNGRSRLINCRGLGTCGTCAVEITCSNSNTSAIKPSERNTKEKLRLNFPPHGSVDQSPNLRLACQVQVYDDIKVKKRTGFWGQDTDGALANEYDAELWFGDLEYVLDNKSPVEDR